MSACPIGNDLSLAAQLLRDGKLVAFGTETVYGLGGDALNPAAVAGIFEAKGRPRFDPLIVHVPNLDAARELAASFPEPAARLAAACWPGPLTLVLPKRERVPDLVTAGLPTVALRIPQHPTTLELLRQAAVPVAAPSANAFGRVSPTTARHVAEQLGDKIDYILDTGPCTVGVESTVVQFVDGQPVLLRPGGTPLEELEQIVGPVRVAASTSHPAEAPQHSPGMLAQHYAPHVPLIVVDLPAGCSADEARDRVAAGLKAAGPPLPGRQPPAEIESPPSLRMGLLTLQPPLPEVRALFDSVEVLSEDGALNEAAAQFFAAMRRLDAAPLDLIVATPFPEQGLGRALNDRLRRAAIKPSPS